VRILVTGHHGNIGVPVTDLLNRQGHEVTGFDRVDGNDLLDLAAVRDAAVGCEAIVHL
jgi:nucleoside-diphosphate-sugar epimerase